MILPEPIAATRIVSGADVNYGALTTNLMNHLKKQDRFTVHFSQMVTDLQRRPGGGWRLEVKNETTGEKRTVDTQLSSSSAPAARRSTLLQKSGIPEGKGYRGLPGERHLAALRQARDRRSPRRQGLRHGGRRLAAHVGAAPRHAHHRRQALGAVRPLCRLLDQVPEARLVVRPAAVAPARATSCRCSRWRATISRSRNIWSARCCRPRTTATRRCASSIPT